MEELRVCNYAPRAFISSQDTAAKLPYNFLKKVTRQYMALYQISYFVSKSCLISTSNAKETISSILKSSS